MSAPTVLLCGYGAFGALHAAAWQALGATVLVADPGADARQRARAAGFDEDAVCDDPKTLLPKADCVAIVSPPDSHLALARIALEAGKPVLLEKPAVCSVDEAHALMAIQEQSGQPVQVNLLLRGHPMTRRASALLDEGGIGKLMVVEGRFCGWKRRHLNVALVENDGVHFLDLMRLFTGSPITQVGARACALPGRDDIDDLVVDTLHANGVTGRLMLGLIGPGSEADAYVPGAQTDKVLRLMGDRGCLTLDYNTNRLTFQSVRFHHSATTLDVLPGSQHVESYDDATPDAMLQESFRTFLEAIKGRGELMVPLREGALELAGLIDAIPAAVEIASAARLDVAEVAA